MVAVVLSEREEDREAFELAAALARERFARLLVVGVPVRAPISISMSPVSLPATYASLRRENIDRMDRRCRSLVSAVAADTPVAYQVLCGGRSRGFERLLHGKAVGAVVLGRVGRDRSLRRAAARWRAQGIEVLDAAAVPNRAHL